MTNNMSIKIENNRFTVSANKEPFIEIKDFIVNTFNNLGSFQIDAYGFNFSAHYHIDSLHEYQMIGDKLAPKKYWKDLLGNEVVGDERKSGLTSIRISKVFDENHSLMIELQPSVYVKNGVFISANDHHVSDNNNNDAEVVMREIDKLFIDRIKLMSSLQENILNEVLDDESE